MFSVYSGLVALVLVLAVAVASEAAPAFRPPAVPLVTHTPYFSIWSQADKLTDCETTHWTGRPMPLRSFLRIDGKAYRMIGAWPADVAPLPQTGLRITPTSSVYEFGNDQASVTIRFTTPALADDLAVLSRPVTYVAWTVKSVDGKPHDVQVYLDEEATVAVDNPEQQVVFSSPKMAADDKHTRLAFDLPGTWAMKHNLIWDRVLGLDLFPKSVGDAEIAWYKTVQGPYGLSCDNRTPQSLIDWAVWTICLADSPRDWEELIGPIHRYVNETSSRMPLSDWFDTKTGNAVGFRARSVVGGVYMKMLLDRGIWKKWAGR